MVVRCSAVNKARGISRNVKDHARSEISDRYRAMDAPRWQINKCSSYLHSWLYKSKAWSEVESVRNDMHGEDEEYSAAMQEVLNKLTKDNPELA
jgi:hypothetical protein